MGLKRPALLWRNDLRESGPTHRPTQRECVGEPGKSRAAAGGVTVEIAIVRFPGLVPPAHPGHPSGAFLCPEGNDQASSLIRTGTNPSTQRSSSSNRVTPSFREL